MSRRKKLINYKPQEASFSLIETVVALGIIAAFLLEYAGVQGNAVYFNSYGQSMTKGLWLAREILNKVEYEASVRPFKQLTAAGLTESESFEKYKELEEDFTYKLTFIDWDPTIGKLLGMNKGSEESQEDEDKQEEGSGGPFAMFDTIIKSLMGDEPKFKIAKVEVSWPEGVHRNSVEAALLVANMKKINSAFVAFGLEDSKPPQGGPPPCDPKKGPCPSGPPNSGVLPASPSSPSSPAAPGTSSTYDGSGNPIPVPPPVLGPGGQNNPANPSPPETGN